MWWQEQVEGGSEQDQGRKWGRQGMAWGQEGVDLDSSSICWNPIPSFLARYTPWGSLHLCQQNSWCGTKETHWQLGSLWEGQKNFSSRLSGHHHHQCTTGCSTCSVSAAALELLEIRSGHSSFIWPPKAATAMSFSQPCRAKACPYPWLGQGLYVNILLLEYPYQISIRIG